eukprot:SAG22_NODE_4200_length_1348_cov_1.405925_1_plen_186_part_10
MVFEVVTIFFPPRFLTTISSLLAHVRRVSICTCTCTAVTVLECVHICGALGPVAFWVGTRDAYRHGTTDPVGASLESGSSSLYVVIGSVPCKFCPVVAETRSNHPSCLRSLNLDLLSDCLSNPLAVRRRPRGLRVSRVADGVVRAAVAVLIAGGRPYSGWPTRAAVALRRREGKHMQAECGGGGRG